MSPSENISRKLANVLKFFFILQEKMPILLVNKAHIATTKE